MKVDTAERLTELALEMSDELNEMVRDIQANEPHNELVRLRQAIGRVMWAIYYEILIPTFEEHPSVEPVARTTAMRSAHQSARSAASGSRRPAQARGSGRQRLR
jgi:hypothetical protein